MMERHNWLFEYKTCEKGKVKRLAKIIVDECIKSLLGTQDLGTIDEQLKEDIFCDLLAGWEQHGLRDDRLEVLIANLSDRLGIKTAPEPHFLQPKFERDDCDSVTSIRQAIEELQREVITLRSPCLDVRLQWLMLFVIMRCGVCYRELANAVLHKALSPDDHLAVVGGFFLLSLTDTRKSHLYNAVDSAGNQITRKTVFLQAEAVAALRGFRKALKNTSSGFLHQASAFMVVRRFFSRHSSLKPLVKFSEKKFYEACALNIWMTPGSQMPVWLRHYAAGSVQSASTSLLSLKRFLENTPSHPPEKLPIKAKVFSEPPAKKNAPLENQKLPKPSKYPFCALMIDALKKPETNHYRRIEDARKRLTRLFALDLTHPQELFLEWSLHELTYGNWNSSTTGYRHLTALCPAWLIVCGHRDLSGLDIAESTELYEQISKLREGSDPRVISSLASLFQFVSAKDGLVLPNVLAKDARGKTGVVNTLITENHFQQLLIDIKRCFADESDFIRESVILMLILMRRTGLRPFEVTRLTLNDISTMLQGAVTIRRNRFGKEKTYSALRQLPLALLLMESEYLALKNFVDKRKNRANAEMRRLLFSASQANDLQFSSSTFTLPVTRLLSSYAGEHVPCYQLRHSCITSLQVILFANDELISRLTPYELPAAKKIRDWIDRSSENDRLYQLSSLAGHLEQSMTLSTYAHFTDLLLFQCCSRIERHYPLDFWTNLIGTRPSSIIKKLHPLPDTNQAKICPEDMYPFLLNSKQAKEPQYSAKVNDTLKSLALKVNKRSIDDCVTVLTNFDKDPSGYLAQVRKHGIDLRWAETLVEVARDTKAKEEYQTCYNGRKYSRLYPANSPKLAPAKPENKTETLVFEDICRKVQAAAGNQARRNAILHTADYMMRNITQGHKQIIFRKPRELHRFLKALSPIVDAKKWLLEIDPPGDVNHRWIKAEWINDTDLVTRLTHKEVRRDFPKGRAKLSFLANHQSAEEIDVTIGVKYSSNALRYALHLFALFQQAEQRFSANSKTGEA